MNLRPFFSTDSMSIIVFWLFSGDIWKGPSMDDRVRGGGKLLCITPTPRTILRFFVGYDNFIFKIALLNRLDYLYFPPLFGIIIDKRMISGFLRLYSLLRFPWFPVKTGIAASHCGLRFWASFPSPEWVHSPGRFGHGRFVPGQVGYGKNGRFRFGHPSAVGASWWKCVRHCHVPHPRIGLPDLQRVRAILQVHGLHEGKPLFQNFFNLNSKLMKGLWKCLRHVF